MRDPEIRSALRADLIYRYGCDDFSLILDEFCVCGGRSRADITVINGQLKAYEIKSERDNLRRLASQVRHYGRVFDTMTLVTTSRHVREAKSILPSWWGVYLVESTGTALAFRTVRKERENPGVDASALVQLVWRDEALELLRLYGLDRGLRSKPRRHLWSALTDNFPLREIRRMVRLTLKNRQMLRVADLQKRCDERYRPCATSSGCHTQPASAHIEQYSRLPS
jgi:hypothetical protein